MHAGAATLACLPPFLYYEGALSQEFGRLRSLCTMSILL